MTQPRACGRTTTSWDPMLFRERFLCVLCTSVVIFVAAVAPAFAQAQRIADLIQSGNRKAALEKIRAGGADVNEAQPDGTRPIHWAVYKVDYELIDALIAKKAKVDVTNEFGS